MVSSAMGYLELKTNYEVTPAVFKEQTEEEKASGKEPEIETPARSIAVDICLT